MSAAVRTGTYAEAVNDVAPVGTDTSTLELVSWNPAGTWAVTTIWRASALASLAKAAVSAAGSAVVKTLPLPALAIASSGWLASPCWSETTSTPTPEHLIASSTSVRFVAVVSSPSERTRILRWPASAPPGPAALMAPSTPSYSAVCRVRVSPPMALVAAARSSVGGDQGLHGVVEADDADLHVVRDAGEVGQRGLLGLRDAGALHAVAGVDRQDRGALARCVVEAATASESTVLPSIVTATLS